MWRVPTKTRESPDLALDLALVILPHAFAHYATVISISSRATERNRESAAHKTAIRGAGRRLAIRQRRVQQLFRQACRAVTIHA